MSSESEEIKRLRKDTFKGRTTINVSDYMTNNLEFPIEIRNKILESAKNLIEIDGRSKVEWDDFARAIRLYKLEGRFYIKPEGKPRQSKEEILKEIENYEYSK